MAGPSDARLPAAPAARHDDAATGVASASPASVGPAPEPGPDRQRAPSAPGPSTVVRGVVIPDELPVVRALFVEYADTLDVDLCVQGFPAELAGLPGRYARPAGGLWIAVADGEPVGCVALRPLGPTVCEIKRLYVRASMRGTGLGRRLATTALDAAEEAGYVSVCLDTLPSMAGAIALYRSLGFVPVAPYDDHPVAGALFFGRAVSCS